MLQIDCLSRKELKEYLAGWSDLEQSDIIEAHLSECGNCEQTIVELESDPDTLFDYVRNVQPEQADKDPHLQEALSAARVLVNHSSAPAPSSWEPPASDVGAYELIQPLGRGGMGSVYLAKHRQLGKQVAIKLLPARTFRSDHFAARFQREVRAAGGLDHPAIVRATDAGESEGTHFLVMEYIEGLDLSRLARLVGKLPIAAACELMRQVALGLSHAHAEGIVHRDIKPSNLMLSQQGETKILDFGLARIGIWDEASVELTTVGQLMGTLDYMAPEQAERADTVDYRADLYALGATLFRLICGRPPLAAAPDLSPLAKLRLLATDDAPLLSTLRSDAPPELVELVKSLLSRDPADRPPSAAHVAERLEQFAANANLTTLIAEAGQSQLDEPDWEGASSPAMPDLQPQLTSTRRSSKWLVAMFLLPLLALGGVLVALETQKGRIIIESDGEVTAKLLRNGEFYRELKIVPGPNSTRLFAGQYEVVIAEGSDAFVIEGSDIALQRMGLEIARIRHADSTGLAATKSLPSSDDVLKPGDTVRMSSLVDSGLGCVATVMRDETIKLPLVGTVSVAEQTLDSMQERLNAEYGKFYKNPSIQLYHERLTRPASEEQGDMRVRAVGIPPASTVPVQPGDGLIVRVAADQSLNSQVVVQADSTIKLVLVGTVSVAGMTVDQVEQELRELYKEFISETQLEVFRDFSVASSWAMPDSTSSVKDDGNADPGVELLDRRMAQLQQQIDELMRVINGKSQRDANAKLREDLNAQLFSLKVTHQDMLSKFGKGHPSIKRAQAQIEMLEKAIGDLEVQPAEPLYEGQPLSQWLELLARERSPQALGVVLVAIDSLVTKETRQRIGDVMLEALPRLDGDAEVALRPDYSTSLDRKAFSILRKAFPDEAFAQMLVQELNRQDPEWSKRILERAYTARGESGPLVDWGIEHITSARDSQLIDLVAIYFFSVINMEYASQEDVERMIKALAESDRLGDEFWLGKNPKEVGWNRQLVDLITKRAIDALIAPGTTNRHATQAAIILQAAMITSRHDVRENLRENEALVEAIQGRISLQAKDLMLDQVEVGSEFSEFVAPKSLVISRSQSTSRRSQPPRLMIEVSGDAKASLPLELLDLAAMLNVECQAELEELASQTEAAWSEIMEFGRGQRMMSLDWNRLELRRAFTQPQSDMPRPQTWLACFVHDQVLRMTPEEAEDPSDSGPSIAP